MSDAHRLEQPRAAATAQAARPILEARDIVKTYGHVEALRGANFSAYAGEVVALIGDNGAGKSTLIKLLSGVAQTRRRQILFEGRPVHIGSPSDAQRLGIETVLPGPRARARPRRRREPLPGPRAAARGPARQARRARQARDARGRGDGVRATSASGIKDAGAPVGYLSGGQRQGVAVARAAAWASKVIIMDEPTAALGVVQSDRVLDVIRRVRDRGLPCPDQPQHARGAGRRRPDRGAAPRAAAWRGSLASEATLESLVGAMTGALQRGGRAVSSVQRPPSRSSGERRPTARSSPPHARRDATSAARASSLLSSTSPLWIFLALVVIVAVFGVLKPQRVPLELRHQDDLHQRRRSR